MENTLYREKVLSGRKWGRLGEGCECGRGGGVGIGTKKRWKEREIKCECVADVLLMCCYELLMCC